VNAGRELTGTHCAFATPLAYARRRHRAASLVELLIALGILAIALNILGQLIFSSLKDSIRARRRAQAVLLAQYCMEDIIAHSDDLDGWEKRTGAAVGKGEETEDQAGSVRYSLAKKDPGLVKKGRLESYTWNWDIRDAPGRSGLKQVTVRVFYTEARKGAKAKAVVLTTLLTESAKTARPIVARLEPTEEVQP